MKIFLLISIIFLFVYRYNLHAQLVTSPADPAKTEIAYTDLNNFIHAHALLKPGVDTVSILQTEYIDKGTAGLKIFIEKYALDAEGLGNAIRKYPQDYAAIKKKMTWLKTQEDSIRSYFKKFKHFVPQAVFPPTYYLVDRRRGIGSGSLEGQLITIEKEASRIIDRGLKTHIVHELVHLNQLHAIGSYEQYLAIYRDEKSLLAITLREGIAEFYAELVTGKYTQEEARRFTYTHEKELWEKFKKEMYGDETGDWMWRDPVNPEQPRDVGYVFGALIAEYFYKKSTDVNQANQELLSLTDYKDFLKKCAYPHKFK